MGRYCLVFGRRFGSPALTGFDDVLFSFVLGSETFFPTQDVDLIVALVLIVVVMMVLFLILLVLFVLVIR